MKTDFTIAIPTYNGAKRLEVLLNSLKGQDIPSDFIWQVIIVDNNSVDNTSEVVKEYQDHWTGNRSLIYAFEPQQGAAFARQKAMQLAPSELVGFLDDDVIPSVNWVIAAYQFGLDHPHAGAYGGRILGKFETAPPENFKRIQSFLALRDRGPHPHLYDPQNLVLPPSAAWTIRKQAWLENVPSTPTLGGRSGKSMVQGDDYEPLLYMHNAGWEIWYNPNMSVEHLIPASRLQDSYLIALSRGCGLCVFQLRLITSKNWEKPIILMKVILGSLKRTCAHLIKHHKQIRTDIVTQCEAVFLLSSLISPLHYFRCQLSSIFRKQSNST
jgi:glycosyltransferase involved in cell wall biosynthesis